MGVFRKLRRFPAEYVLSFEVWRNRGGRLGSRDTRDVALQ